ncbi:MAG: hypothetical protein K6F05_06325 [Succinivibrio sp.]|nr:hypothetical protein [Succinivibrio sp.]
MELTSFKNESITLTKWLIAIPSVTDSSGENIIINAVHDGIKEFNYFRRKPHDLRFIEHKDGKNHSILALVRTPKPKVKDTLILLCNTDTSNNDTYGMLKSLAFKSDELKEKLKVTITERNARNDLFDEETLYGLGSYECKFATGALIVFLKDMSDKLENLPINLLFVCTSNTIGRHQGIRECLEPMHDLLRQNDLEYRLAVNFAPKPYGYNLDNLPLYSANFGVTEVCFYILGQGSDNQTPFAGFSPTLIAAKLIQKLELNPNFTKTLSKKPLIPMVQYLNCYGNRSRNSPDAVQIGISMPFVNLNFSDLLEELKQAAVKALEEASINTDDRYSTFKQLLEEHYDPTYQDAEVLSYSDLFYRARRHYRGNLESAIEGLLQKCHKDGYDQIKTAKIVIERLNDLSHLPRPSIVVYFSNNFIPQQRLTQANSYDRELFIKLDKALTFYNNRHDKKICMADEYGPSDCCFIRPIGIDQAVKVLDQESPLPLNTFYNLNAPAITLCLDGKDLYKTTEHIPLSNFEVIPSFMQALFKMFGTEDEELQKEISEQEAEYQAVTDDNSASEKEAPLTSMPSGAQATLLPGTEDASETPSGSALSKTESDRQPDTQESIGAKSEELHDKPKEQ